MVFCKTNIFEYYDVMELYAGELSEFFAERFSEKYLIPQHSLTM